MGGVSMFWMERLLGLLSSGLLQDELWGMMTVGDRETVEVRVIIPSSLSFDLPKNNGLVQNHTSHWVLLFTLCKN